MFIKGILLVHFVSAYATATKCCHLNGIVSRAATDLRVELKVVKHNGSTLATTRLAVQTMLVFYIIHKTG